MLIVKTSGSQRKWLPRHHWSQHTEEAFQKINLFKILKVLEVCCLWWRILTHNFEFFQHYCNLCLCKLLLRSATLFFGREMMEGVKIPLSYLYSLLDSQCRHWSNIIYIHHPHSHVFLQRYFHSQVSWQLMQWEHFKTLHYTVKLWKWSTVMSKCYCIYGYEKPRTKFTLTEKCSLGT